MKKTKIYIFSFLLLFFIIMPSQSSMPIEPLSDIVNSSPYIFIGKFISSKRTPKKITRGFVDYYYYITRLQIDTLIKYKEGKKIKYIDVVNVPLAPNAVDTAKNIQYLYFLSGATTVLDSGIDLMVERQYKIYDGKIFPTYILDESYEQPLSKFLLKIKKIVKEQTKIK